MRRETKIGIFAIAVLLSAFFTINYLRGADVFGKDITLISHYETADGLVPSNPVYMKGYKAGTVSKVEYNPETGMFDVTCTVMKKMRIPEDSKMTIYSVDLMGGKGIRLDPGSSTNMVKNGAELVPAYAPDMVSSLTDKITPLIEKAAMVFDSLAVTSGELNRILSGVDEKSVNRVISHAETTLANIEKLSDGLADSSPAIDSLILNLKNVSGKLIGLCDKADTAMKGISGITASLSEADLEGLVASFKNVVDKLDDPDGTLGKMLTDDGVYTSVDSLLKDIDSLIKNIEANPKKYLRIKASLF